MLRDQSRVAVGFLWKKKDSKDKAYLAGVLSMGVFGEIPIVVFEETNKERDNSPDFIIRLATEKPKAVN